MSAGEVKPDKTTAEKRLDEYLDGLFWISVFGLGFIVGGTALLSRFGVRDLIVLAYFILSSTIFLINFGFSLWGTLSIMRSRDGKLTMRPGHDTHELSPPSFEPIPATSVTENTTRSLVEIEQNRTR